MPRPLHLLRAEVRQTYAAVRADGREIPAVGTEHQVPDFLVVLGSHHKRDRVFGIEVTLSRKLTDIGVVEYTCFPVFAPGRQVLPVGAERDARHRTAVDDFQQFTTTCSLPQAGSAI